MEPGNPHNFWSAGEDGVVRQYDTRAPNQESWESPTVLVQVRAVRDGAAVSAAGIPPRNFTNRSYVAVRSISRPCVSKDCSWYSFGTTCDQCSL